MADMANVRVYDKFVERVQECGDLYVRFLEIGWDGQAKLKPADAVVVDRLLQALAWVWITGRAAIVTVSADLYVNADADEAGWGDF